MERNSAGFTLQETLLVSALGSLLLLTITQIFASLTQQQAEQAAWLRLEERAGLVSLVLKQDLAQSYQLIKAGAASHNYPDFQEVSLEVTAPQINKATFSSFRSSDWLITNRKAPGVPPSYSLWHVDEKEYGRGLAHKTSVTPSAKATQQPRLSSSQTLIAQVEMLRLRLYDPATGEWLRVQDFTLPWHEVQAIQFAVVIASDQPIRSRPANESFTLWGKAIQLPNDGHLRTLVMGRSQLKRPLP